MQGDDEDDDDQELRTFVMVHDIKPPFLDGRLVLSNPSGPNPNLSNPNPNLSNPTANPNPRSPRAEQAVAARRPRARGDIGEM